MVAMPSDGASPTRRALLALAMVWPLLAALLYFRWLDGHRLAVPVYFLGKLVQFSLPLLQPGLLQRLRRQLLGPGRRRYAIGALSGAAMATAVITTHSALVRATPLGDTIAERIEAKITGLGLGMPLTFLAFACLLATCHSLLEELYWRGYVFAELQRQTRPLAAACLAATAFTAHHVVVIWTYVPPAAPWLRIAAVAALIFAGVFWCWLYAREGLRSAWLSHVFADLAVLGIGYDLIFGVGS